jgi:hypothetical protein
VAGKVGVLLLDSGQFLARKPSDFNNLICLKVSYLPLRLFTSKILVLGGLLNIKNALLASFMAFSLCASHASAQDQGDVYDPFIDYSEFEEAGREEKDVNFFRHGRMFTAGVLVGQRSFTSNMGNVFDPGVGFGFYFGYFFDMRLALQFTYFTASHDVSFTESGTPIRGDASIGSISLDMKYYIHAQNMTRGLPKFNPYVIGGFSSVSREVNLDGQTSFVNERPMGFNVGGGIEIPMMRGESYVGAQFVYQLVSFKDEGSTDPRQDGDLLNFTAFIGLNF